MAQNLLRAAGTLAGPLLAKARAATIRRDLIAVAARTARHGRGNITLHLPEGWHRERQWLTCETRPADRPPKRPDQPRPGPHPHAARHTSPRTPGQEPVDRPQKRQRRHKHTRKRLVEASGLLPPHSAFNRWIEAEQQAASDVSG
jgi:hypothetical protein